MFPLANSQRFRLCSVPVLVYICTVLCLPSIFYIFSSTFLFLFLFLHLGLGHDKRRPPVRPSTALSIYLSDLHVSFSPSFSSSTSLFPHFLLSFTNMLRPVITHFSLLDIARDILHNSGLELNDFGFPCPHTQAWHGMVWHTSGPGQARRG